MTEVNKILKNTSAYQIAESLDKQDGSADGKISASIWNAFVEGKGGKKINTSITLENAMKSITSYAVRNAKSEKTTANDLGEKWLNSPSAEKSEKAVTSEVANAEKAGNVEAPEEVKEAKPVENSENVATQEVAKDMLPTEEKTVTPVVAEEAKGVVPEEKSENTVAKEEAKDAAPAKKSVNPDTSKGTKEVAQESQKTEVPESSATENKSKKNPVRANTGAKKTPAPVARARNSKPRKNPVGSNAGTSKAAAAKQQGLRATYNPNYYYSETEKEHYRWNPKTQKFVKYSNIAYFNKDQSYVRKYKNKDGSSKVVDYSKDGYPTKMQARNSKNEIYLNKDIAVKKLGLRETYATKSKNVYYDEATKIHYKWNDKTHSFDALYGYNMAKISFVDQSGWDYTGNVNVKVIKYSNGVNKKETYYEDGKKSLVKQYNSSGYTTYEEHYENGVKTESSTYKLDASNKRIGVTYTFYSNGKVHKVEYVLNSDGSLHVTKRTEMAH